MSLSGHNTHIGKSALGEWRTLTDPEDRKPSEVVTYKLSPEEIVKRYGPIEKRVASTEKVPFMLREEGRLKSKIKRVQLLEECKTLGLNVKAYKAIGEKYGLSYRTIMSYADKWGVMREIRGEGIEHREYAIHI